MKKFFVIIFVYLILINSSFGKVSTSSQRSLINTNVISENVSCNKLSEIIGGLNQTDLLWLDNKNGENNQFALLNTRTKENDKIYYICGNINNLLTASDSTYEVLNDRSLIKIFYNSSDLFSYVFSITGPKSTQYILSRLILEDFNITRPELILAFQNSLKLDIDDPIEIVETPDDPIITPIDPPKPDPEIIRDQNPPVIKIASTFNFNETKSSYVFLNLVFFKIKYK